MIDALTFLAAPAAMCFVLIGIHCYLGLHVLARGVIFVDLSLAQVAALGATIAVAYGVDHESIFVYFSSLLATFIAALLFAGARRLEKKISQEALIGIVYALGAAGVILLVNNTSHGAEHIKNILIGQILWVTWFDVAKTALVYLLVGLIHFIFRRELLEASFKKSSTGSKWDFMFYALFGVVITSSVRVAGILQVFSFLIVPAILGSYFFQSIKARLLFGWIFGSLLSLMAMGISFSFDLPTGAFIVVSFTLCPVLLVIFNLLRPKEAKRPKENFSLQ